MKSSTLFALFLLSAIFTSYLPSATAGDLVDTDGLMATLLKMEEHTKFCKL
ncbi:hypothetical protein AAZX31_08G331900 [Glycine max]|nr:hypothetical protein GLYMA_08G342051v4 [Glycine max]KAH1054461.1 hypothetical protein GYH30_023300 [Glycine max]